MAKKAKDDYKKIAEELRKYNSDKQLSYMLVMIGFSGIVLVIILLALWQSI
tara:strand:+ start:869 stop:1021 length:153 start_codon:yes stop_codon:yes gene_type:complete